MNKSLHLHYNSLPIQAPITSHNKHPPQTMHRLILSRTHRASHGLHRHFAAQAANTATAPSTTTSSSTTTTIPGENELHSSYQQLLATDSTSPASDMSTKATTALSKLSKLFQDLENNTTTYQPKHAFVALKVWEKTLLHAPNETLQSVEQFLPQIESFEERRNIAQQLDLANLSDPDATAKINMFAPVQRTVTELNELKKRKNPIRTKHFYRTLLATVNEIWCTFSSTYGRGTTLIPPSLIVLNMQVLQACGSFVSPAEITAFVRQTLFHHIPATLQPTELHNRYMQQLCTPERTKGSTPDNGIETAIEHLHRLERKQLPKPDFITYSIVLTALSKSSKTTRHQDIVNIFDRSVLLNKVNNQTYGIDPSKKIATQRTARRQVREIGQTARKAIDETQLRKNIMKDIQTHQDGWDWFQTLDPNTANIRDVECVLKHQLNRIKTHNTPTKVASYALQNTYSDGFMEALDRMPSDGLNKDVWWSNQVEKVVQYMQEINHSRRLNNTKETMGQPLHMLKMNTATCNLLLKGCALSRDKDCAQKIWNNMICAPTETTSTQATTETSTTVIPTSSTKYRIVPDKDTRHYLIASILNATGSIEEIQKYWQLTTDLQPRMTTVNNLLKRITNHSGVSGGLHFLNRQTTSKNHGHLIAPDVYTLNILLKGCAKEGQVGAAFSLLNGARLTWNNVLPNVMSYSILMQCYRTNNDPIGAYGAFTQMLQQDIVPDNVACARMVQIFAEFGEEEAASHFLIQAKNNGWIDYQTMVQLEEYVADFEEEGEEEEEEEEVDDGMSYDDEEDLRTVLIPSLIPLPGENMLSISHDRDQWLLNEISMLTPGSSTANVVEMTEVNNFFQQPLIKEEVMADVHNELRLSFEKGGYIKVVESGK